MRINKEQLLENAAMDLFNKPYKKLTSKEKQEADSYAEERWDDIYGKPMSHNIKKDINFAENVLGFAENEKFDINKFKKDLSVNGWKTYKELNDSISDACTEYGKNERADKPNETWVNKNHTKAVSFFNSLDEIATIDIHGPSIHDWDWVITDQPISLIKSISVTSESIRISRISKR